LWSRLGDVHSILTNTGGSQTTAGFANVAMVTLNVTLLAAGSAIEGNLSFSTMA